MIDPKIRDIIEAELEPGEELLWSGHPQGPVILIQYMFLIIPLIIIILNAAFSPLSLVLFLPFSALCVSFTLFHSWLCTTQRYLVTDKRVVILFRPEWIPKIEIRPGKPYWITKLGTQTKGSLYFADQMPMIPRPFRFPVFERLPDANPFEGSSQRFKRGIRSYSCGFFNISDTDKVIALLPISIMPDR